MSVLSTGTLGSARGRGCLPRGCVWAQLTVAGTWTPAQAQLHLISLVGPSLQGGALCPVHSALLAGRHLRAESPPFPPGAARQAEASVPSRAESGRGSGPCSLGLGCLHTPAPDCPVLLLFIYHLLEASGGLSAPASLTLQESGPSLGAACPHSNLVVRLSVS